MYSVRATIINKLKNCHAKFIPTERRVHLNKPDFKSGITQNKPYCGSLKH
jgi:hypothetical protein